MSQRLLGVDSARRTSPSPRLECADEAPGGHDWMGHGRRRVAPSGSHSARWASIAPPTWGTPQKSPTPSRIQRCGDRPNRRRGDLAAGLRRRRSRVRTCQGAQRTMALQSLFAHLYMGSDDRPTSSDQLRPRTAVRCQRTPRSRSHGFTRPRDTTCSCFAVEGARAAHRFAATIGWNDERCDRLAEAISLHLNVQVGLRHGPEAHLLHEGAALDVNGARLRDIGSKAVSAVLQEYPRLELKKHLVESMKEQARAMPGSRAAFLAGLGSIGLIRSAPFEEAPHHE